MTTSTAQLAKMFYEAVRGQLPADHTAKDVETAVKAAARRQGYAGQPLRAIASYSRRFAGQDVTEAPATETEQA